MKTHPATKRAEQLLKERGYRFFRTYPFVFRIYGDVDHIDVDLELSLHADVARFSVCPLYSNISLYEELRESLHGLTFGYKS